MTMLANLEAVSIHEVLNAANSEYNKQAWRGKINRYEDNYTGVKFYRRTEENTYGLHDYVVTYISTDGIRMIHKIKNSSMLSNSLFCEFVILPNVSEENKFILYLATERGLGFAETKDLRDKLAIASEKDSCCCFSRNFIF